jgi:hypothetical protein
MNSKIFAELEKASTELSEATAALAILCNEHEKARHKAQVRVTMATGRVTALVSMAGAEADK